MVSRLRFLAFFVLLAAVIFTGCSSDKKGEIGTIEPPIEQQQQTAVPDTKVPQFAGLVEAVETYAVDGNVELKWAAASDEVTPPESITYLIYAGTSPVNFEAKWNYETKGVTSFKVPVDAEKIYYFAVRAMDQQANIDTNTVEKSVKVPAAGVGVPPPVVKDSNPPAFNPVFLTHAYANHIAVCWDKAVDPEGAAVTYNVYISSKNVFDVKNPEADGAVKMTTEDVCFDIKKDIQPNSTYFILVTAQDAAGNVAGANFMNIQKIATPNVVEPVVDKTPPVFDQNKIGIHTYVDRIALCWVTANDPEGSVPISYTVYYGPDSFSAKDPAAKGANGVSTVDNCITLTNGIKPASTYYILVVARDSAGNIAGQDDLNIKKVSTPADTKGPVLLSAPTLQFGITPNSNGMQLLVASWHAAVDATPPVKYSLVLKLDKWTEPVADCKGPGAYCVGTQETSCAIPDILMPGKEYCVVVCSEDSVAPTPNVSKDISKQACIIAVGQHPN